MIRPECTSTYIVSVGSFSSEALGSIIETLDRFPGSVYLRTDQACSSLAPAFGPNAGSLAGMPSYMVVFGPYDKVTACQQLGAAQAVQGDAYMRILDNTSPVGTVISCP